MKGAILMLLAANYLAVNEFTTKKLTLTYTVKNICKIGTFYIF